MAWRLSDIVVCGEIYNTSKNSVHGVLGLRDCERPVSLQLTGNCDPDLAGRSFRFEVRESPMQETRSTSEAELDEQHFAWMQVGSPGTMTAARKVRAFDCSVEEFLHRSQLGEQPPTEWKRCLYLEWYSQNGRVVLELVDPLIEFLDDQPDTPSANEIDDAENDPFESGDSETIASGPQITAFEIDDDGNMIVEDLSPDLEDIDDADDPYGLFPAELESEIGTSSDVAGWRPEADEETLKLWAQWDEIFDGTKDVPICTLFDPPLKLAPADRLDDVQVQIALSVLLGRLAQHGLALDMCEHATPRDGYRFLVEDVLRTEFAHPDLLPTGFVRHYSMSDDCEHCQAEFDRRYAAEHPDVPDDRPRDSDLPF